MALKHVFFILALICLIMENIANATSRNDHLNNNIKQDYDLATRFEDSGGLTECWNALMELKSCSNEIVIFFLNKGNILRGYCDASSAPSPGGLAVIYQPQVSKILA
ncbi:Egg cell-secreted protein 1.4 [Citrus sinensis]|uniref:Egg cell-secreted protein 1.4 n=1 Tax=Citrus sinensis TaxID=2711 RepID=A0ACB8NDV6_CITSI|nr:Egg cell-secreted protein 1.4 [Citrus sinensis]